VTARYRLRDAVRAHAAPTVVCLTLTFLMTGLGVAAAQDRLFIGPREVGALGHFAETKGPAPTWVHSPRFGGERFVHFSNGVLDLQTGAVISLGRGFVVAYDRARPRVFLGRQDGVWQEEVTTSFSQLVLPRPTVDLVACTHAASADVLVCAYARPDGQYDLVRPGVFSPVVVGTTRFATPIPNWVITPDAARLYFAHCARVTGQAPPFVCLEQDLAVLDMATGGMRTVPMPDAFTTVGALQWDEARDRLFSIGARVDVLSRDLRHIGTASGTGRCRAVAVSPHTGRAYLAVDDYAYGWSTSVLSAYDALTYQTIEPPREHRAGPCLPLALLTAPGAPRDVRAVATGRTVHLAWTNVGAASHFVLDVGLAPGRTDLSVFMGWEPNATFFDVPPGTYYLRVRGGNLIGGGQPSAEIVVRVR
jgi:hypothetical protein